MFDKTRFGPLFMAQIAVSKCADSLPLYRQAKAYRRVGVQVDDSTLGDLFHRTAEIVESALRAAPGAHLREGDRARGRDDPTRAGEGEDPHRLDVELHRPRRDRQELIAYVFANSRSGETPVKVLGDSEGKLVADAYSGYNKVTRRAAASAPAASPIIRSPPLSRARPGSWRPIVKSRGDDSG